MKQFRGGSQILFGFLPDQTVDLAGRVWRVKEWRHPLQAPIDDTALRRELIKQVSAWTAQGLDSGYGEDLRRGRSIRVLTLDKQNGVAVELFPKVFMCRSCKRVPKEDETTCRCGRPSFGQLPFVGYHDGCGSIRQPWIPRCKAHDDVEIVLPGTASASEIVFRCPICRTVLRKGFGFQQCHCGRGRWAYNVHRAASVYTPRTVVIVNPPSLERVERLTAAGGPERALAWVVDGLRTDAFEQVGNTRDSLRAQLLANGLSPDLVERMVAQAEAAGELAEGAQELTLPSDRRAAAEQEAVTIAMGLAESRLRLGTMAASAPAGSPRGKLYRETYPAAIGSARLESVDLVDRFPVLTGNFGYTRGSSTPGESRLIPFRGPRDDYAVYADVGETEALFVQLSPEQVAGWLLDRGHALDAYSDARSARLSILRAAAIPEQGVEGNEAGRDLLKLVHSYSHRFMRLAATQAGIERNSLSELVVPLHLGFFAYAAARGDFVLGGLQALFEAELHPLLHEIRGGDHRCPLDPGCQRAGGACMACLHVGEPSCRYFNGSLDRRLLVEFLTRTP